jgi:signal transduction histidine kinase
VYIGPERSYDRFVKSAGRSRDWWLDLGLCTVLLGWGAYMTMLPNGNGADTAVDTLVMPAVILPVLLRRRAPFAAAAALATGAVVSGIPTFDQVRCGFAVPAALLILFSLGTRADLRRAVAGLALVLAAMIFIGFTDEVLRDDVAGFSIFSFPLCIGAWGAGRVARSRDLVAARLAKRTRLLESRREQTALLAVDVERTRLASDLDVATRSGVRAIIELAATGERSLAGDGERSRRAFGEIERAGRQSLNEMRGLLGVLRSDERSKWSPRPVLSQVERLMEQARAGGRLVDFEVTGQRRLLPDSIELAAYRALQHMLVAVGGAKDEPATVQVRYLSAALELEVCGFPTEVGGEAALMAAREQMTAYGGGVSVSSSRPGWRVVRARLPLVAAHV